MAHALRHAPPRYGLTLDPHGWVSMEDMVSGRRGLGPEWAGVDAAAIERSIEAVTKKRYEAKDGRVRAVHGHSVEVDTQLETATPPAALFHGTSREALEAILAEGLKPMRRQFVHLDETVEHAVTVGSRKQKDPVILRVDTAAILAAGLEFSRATSGVWVVPAVPPTALRVEA